MLATDLKSLSNLYPQSIDLSYQASPLLAQKLGQLMQKAAICNASVGVDDDSDFAVCGAAIMSRFKANFLATQWAAHALCVCVCEWGGVCS